MTPHIDAVPSDQEIEIARRAARVLQGRPAGTDHLSLQLAAAGEKVATLELPAVAREPLLAMLHAMAEGKPVSVYAADTEVTTQQAADILNVSRPFLVHSFISTRSRCASAWP